MGISSRLGLPATVGGFGGVPPCECSQEDSEVRSGSVLEDANAKRDCNRCAWEIRVAAERCTWEDGIDMW
jgi:hypothetical protein